MIGGNFKSKLTKELFIRWVQASVFMPTQQFSVTPWDFDEETVNISRKFTSLHEAYAYLIIERFHKAVNSGDPGLPDFKLLR